MEKTEIIAIPPHTVSLEGRVPSARSRYALRRTCSTTPQKRTLPGGSGSSSQRVKRIGDINLIPCKRQIESRPADSFLGDDIVITSNVSTPTSFVMEMEPDRAVNSR